MQQPIYVIVNRKPNHLFTQGKQLFKHYEQIYEYFAEGKQKDNSAQNSKFLQLHNVKVSDYLTKKYALSLDFRTIDENTLHEARR